MSKAKDSQRSVDAGGEVSTVLREVGPCPACRAEWSRCPCGKADLYTGDAPCIMLACLGCGLTVATPRADFDPVGAVRCESFCGDCNKGKEPEADYYDADGNLIVEESCSAINGKRRLYHERVK